MDDRDPSPLRTHNMLAYGRIHLRRTSYYISDSFLHERVVSIFDLQIELPAPCRHCFRIGCKRGVHILASANGAKESTCSFFNGLQVFLLLALEAQRKPAYFSFRVDAVRELTDFINLLDLCV